jgi:uncharacterized repeat protein (TIGR01451 family)
MSQYRRILIGVVSLLLYSPVYGFAQPQYTVTDLGAPFAASGINDSAMVTGAVSIEQNEYAVRLMNGVRTALNVRSQALGINTSGEAVVTLPAQPMRWMTDGTLELLPVSTGTTAAQATGINDARQVSGWVSVGYPSVAVRWDGNVMTPLPSLGNDGDWGVAINAQGDVAGVAYGFTADGRLGILHAVVWDSSGALRDLGTAGGDGLTLEAINDARQLVGSVATLPDYRLRAFGGDVATGITLLPIPTGYVESSAWGISATGQRIGVVRAADARVVFPARWNSDGTVHNLNTLIDPASGWTIQHAGSISPSGLIVGYGLLQGHWRLVLLTPIPAGPSLAMRLNQNTFQLGQTLRVTIDLSNPGPILTTDVYVGVILPDGETLFMTNVSPLEGVMTTLNSDPRTFARLLRNVSWPAGMRATQQDYFTHTFTGLEPLGTYHFLVGWTKPNSLEDGRIDEGDVLALAWAPFTFTRGGTEALYVKMQAIRARQAK